MQLRSRTILSLILVTCLTSEFSSARFHNGQRVNAMKMMSKTVRMLGDQLQIQQFAQENSKRSEGISGIVRTRDVLTGPYPYDRTSFAGRSVGAMHNHANEKRTIGMGEIVAILNGVEFQTRHNDFILSQPSKTTKKFMEQQHLEFPSVPQEVLDKTSVADEIREMREWFKAFQTQDFSIRDYRPYFKANLCYLEGGWSVATDEIKEPFPSRRHRIRAYEYSELKEKCDFVSESGTHMRSEDYAILPRKIIGYTENRSNGTRPVFAQWNYRIACHPLEADLPTKMLVPMKDMSKRLSDKQTFKEFIASRACRFAIRDVESETHSTHMPRIPTSDLLDRLMSEIPGKDNYPGNLEDNTHIEGVAYDFSSFGNVTGTILNSAYYHRLYAIHHPRHMAFLPRRRGFSDESIFMSMNTRPEMVPTELKDCFERSCVDISQKWTYAIPLEVVYTTPLTKWNPRNLVDRGSDTTSEGKKVRANGRNGGCSPDVAFDGVNDGTYFLTPAEFYSDTQPNELYPADTGMPKYGVLDQSGTVQTMLGSGHRIMQPLIPGVPGRVRTRYPVSPAHEEGSAVWKELAALREMILESEKYSFMYNEDDD